MSSVPQENYRAALAAGEEDGRREGFLARHGALICLILGFALLGFVGVLALSPQLTCRLTGFDCPARPVAAPRVQAPRAPAAPAATAPAVNPVDAAAAQAALRASLQWKAARDCAAAANACGARACYATYLSESGEADPHAEEARREEARFAESCGAVSAAMDGRYLARSQAACGIKPASVIVEIHGGEISWRHEFQGVVYQWRGVVDASGALRASIGASPGYEATGSLTETERAAAMVYPDCPEGIPMRVVNKLPD